MVKQKLTYEFVFEFFKEKGCQLLSKEYTCAKQKLKYTCSCGNPSEIAFHHFRDGHRCSKCGGTEKLQYEYIKSYFEEKGCKLLSKRYDNSNSKLKYICSCGNPSSITFHNFKYGYRCKKCGDERTANHHRHEYNFVKKYFEEHDCNLLTKKYINNEQILDFICSCGNPSKIRFSSFQQGQRCKKCFNAT
ncbi:hypothetical protein [Niallia oryzisoli]|uniref:hypothetical protein n=1 Tax=Niallia oryzisoli TaxID=1737571 RepID=UPI00373701B4